MAWLGDGGQIRRSKQRGAIGKEHPGGERLATGVVGCTINLARGKRPWGLLGGVGEPGENRGEVEILVGDVKGENAARGEVAQVEGERLACEQVRGDAVAGKGMDREEVEVLGRFGGQDRRASPCRTVTRAGVSRV